MSVEIHAGVRICGQTFGSAQVREAVQVFHFSVKWDRFLQPFHTFTVDHDSIQATKNCWLSGWTGCCIHPSPLEVSSISWIRVWEEIRFFFFLSYCYFLSLVTQQSLFSFALGLIICEDTKKKGKIGLLTEFHGAVDYFVTESKQWCCKFCTFMRKFHSQLNSLCQFINVKGILYTYFSMIQSSLNKTQRKCVLFIYSTVLLFHTWIHIL